MAAHTFSAPQKKEYQFSSSLNIEHLAELYENDIERAKEMFEMYLEILPASLSELKYLCKAQSYTELAAAFHKIKSCFGLVGLSNLEVSAKSLERKSQDFAKGTATNYQILESAVTVFIDICERANFRIENEVAKMESFLIS